ncbi:hypothetical protein KW796_01775 [Candidatus Parcubacteria bacterium]|nr:hypothetical protein [Candidatus Parcubacteria bacterium]
MEPKFQSSFIPKGPLATAGIVSRISRESSRSILGTLAVFIFTFAVLLSLGVFGYELYLNQNIKKMGVDLNSAHATLEPETITKISRLDSRIVSTGKLLDRHIVLSPLFTYLENSTLKTVRFNEFQYKATDKGLELSMRGQARGYAAVALQSEIFNKSPYFKQPIFADLDLDDKGNVTFSFKAYVDPTLVSYKEEVDNLPTVTAPNAPLSAVTILPTATSSSTAKSATTTAPKP